MSEPSAKKLKAFAQQLLACEAALGNPVGAKDSRAFRGLAKLRAPLSKLIGVGGFRALLSRAQALAGEEVNWLYALDLKADGLLDGLETELTASEVAAGEAALIAQMTGLLVTFIGPALTMQLLREIWPEIPTPDFGTRGPT